MSDTRHILPKANAFTLIELLTVIAIIGILAALTVPVLKNFGKSDVTVSASRQLLDDVGRARQLAMSQRTTVYMVFVPTNFWINQGNGKNLFSSGALGDSNNTNVLFSLLGMQLTGYTFMADGAVGDQPGNHQWHYLASWQSLPAGAYIPLWKFYNSRVSFNFNDPVNSSIFFNINAFPTNAFPFPAQDETNNYMLLPYIAFNYLGQLATVSGQLFVPQPQSGLGDLDFTGGGVDIPLVQGSLLNAKDPTTRQLQIGSPQVIESPPGNGTNISYNVVHIDPLTGRATLEYHKLQ
jgi:prepilin-type N-terminal cleavage/methylation domain-containing protein